MTCEAYLAIDLGAESGRAILGRMETGRLALDEIHRFSNGPVRVNEHLHWDVLRLWSEILASLRKGSAQCSGLASLGVDTWGVDFALLDAHGVLIGNPYHYRDSRTDGMLEAGYQLVPREEIYRQTGAQFLQLNSLFQLLAMRLSGDPALECARTFLNLPDLFNFWLTGRKASEFTVATTSQCYDPTRKGWAFDLLRKMGLPTAIFQEILHPGAVYGRLRPSVASETGVKALQVAVIGSHDTASAVAAVPARSSRYVFISSGTWSLVGSELPGPLITADSLRYNFTNEGGVGGKYRFLKNISALWMVQECRRAWAAEGQSYSYDALTRLAELAPAFKTLVDPDDPAFLSPGGMPGRMRRFALAHGQPPPETNGEFIRTALESLALAYRQVIEQLEATLGYALEAIHIVGGGSRNRLLNQFTADATGLPVVAGPVEATAIGNILLQAMAQGRLGSLDEARELVRRSFPLETFEPGPRSAWEAAYDRWRKMIHRVKG